MSHCFSSLIDLLAHLAKGITDHLPGGEAGEVDPSVSRFTDQGLKECMWVLYILHPYGRT